MIKDLENKKEYVKQKLSLLWRSFQADHYFWLMSVSPFMVSSLQRWLSLDGILMFFVLLFSINSIWAFLDYSELQKNDRKVPDKWTRFIFIVYMWQRFKCIKMKKRVLVTWFVIFVLSVFLLVGNNLHKLEQKSCRLVTKIIYNEYGAGHYTGNKIGAYLTVHPELDTPDCVSVSIYEFLENKRYRAIATLENGNRLKIRIKIRNKKLKVSIVDLSRDLIE
jgi:hypothetical protein